MSYRSCLADVVVRWTAHSGPLSTAAGVDLTLISRRAISSVFREFATVRNSKAGPKQFEPGKTRLDSQRRINGRGCEEEKWSTFV